MLIKLLSQGGLVAVLSLWLGSQVAYADSKVDYLARSVREGASFRVRVQAALALGSIGKQSGSSRPQIISALMTALSDSHPAVRAAATGSMARVAGSSDKNVLMALQRASRDSDTAVRQSALEALNVIQKGGNAKKPKFYVAVGPTAARGGVMSNVLEHAQYVIMREMASVPTVVLAPENEAYADAANQVKSKHLTGYYLDSSLVRMVEQGGMTRAEVSVVVSSYPDRDIRMMLSGAAAAEGARDSEELQKQIIEVALSSALRRFSQSLDASRATRVSSY